MAKAVTDHALTKPFALAVNGTTFFERMEPKADEVEVQESKAHAIARIFAKLLPVFIVPGSEDLMRHATAFQHLRTDFKLATIKTIPSGSTVDHADSTLFRIGNVMVGIVGGSAQFGVDPAALVLHARSARVNGADVVVALVPIAFDAAKALAEKLIAIDVVVAEGSDVERTPVVIGNAVVVEALNRGQHLGLLTFEKRDGQPWIFSDRGETKRHQLASRINALERSIANLEAGPAREKRESMLAELKKDLDAPATAQSTQSVITWQTQPIRKTIEREAWATKILAEYNRSLCTLAVEATDGRQCTPAPNAASAYVGTDACKACHAQAYALYQKTAHARAWKTMEDAGKQCDSGCIGCHSVGFEKAGGYCRIRDAVKWTNVGCENCHGPGSGHIANIGNRNAWGEFFRADPSADTCVGCHNHEHSDRFDFGTYLPKILGPGHEMK